MSLLNFLKSLFGGKKADVEMPVTINPDIKKNATKEVFPPLENKVEETKVAAPIVEKKAEVVAEVKSEPTVKEIKAKSAKVAKTTEEPQKEKPKSKPKPKPKKDSK